MRFKVKIVNFDVQASRYSVSYYILVHQKLEAYYPSGLTIISIRQSAFSSLLFFCRQFFVGNSER